MKQYIQLLPLEDGDRAQFIKDNQEAFSFAATEALGLRDEPFEAADPIISRETIEESIDGGEAYRIVNQEGKFLGGMVVTVEGKKGNLDLFFVSPDAHSKGIGYAAWYAMETLHPEVNHWETVTPYFEQRNIHFYVNRCGFHIVEFFNPFHPDPHDPETGRGEMDSHAPDGMFRLEKVLD